MLKKTITYSDYNEVERTEDFYFNLTKAELIEMELSTVGGLEEMVQRIIAAQDAPSLVKVFKDIIFKAYGEKSPDGKRFMKSEELSKNFSYTEAYSILFTQLATDASAATEFINGIIPQDSDNTENKNNNSNISPMIKS